MTTSGEIQVGDSKELSKSIPDESVDMVFTDPIYSNMEDYAWLGRESLRVLKENSPLLVWCSSNKQYKAWGEIVKYLNLRLPLFYVVTAKAGKLFLYKAITWTTPILVFSKGKFTPVKWFVDTFVSSLGARADSGHKHNKNLGVTEYYLTHISLPGSLVWDPFTGYGTIPVACKRNGYEFIASEVDPEVAQAAINRVSTTRRYLF